MAATSDPARRRRARRGSLERPVNARLYRSSFLLVSLPLLTVGLAIGVIRQSRDGGSFDERELLTLVAWIVYGGFLAARPTGRRAACLALGGFVLVVVARVALAGSHFT